jgi:spermidine synthase
MIMELAAVRLLAPWFGTSLVVWTNVIAVVLLGLAGGYWMGGRLATGSAPVSKLGGMLLLAGPLTAFIPAFSGPLARFFLPSELALHEAASLVLWGSLAVSLVLFLPPAALLGAVSPLAVESVARMDRRSAGNAGGKVLASGTLGSLVGVFSTSHVLVPQLGLIGTFLTASLFLCLAGALALRVAKGKVSSVAAPIVLWLAAVGLGVSRTATYGSAGGPSPPEGWRVLQRGESPYQSVRVVEGPDDERGLFRYLQVNEGFDSFQSVWQEEPGLLPAGFYYNDFALPAHWGDKSGSWSVLILGLGAGTAVRVIEGAAPPGLSLDFTGIELDPLVVEFAKADLELIEDETHRVHADLDARVALRALDQEFDQIVLDCYANQIEIPPHLCTLEFFREVRAHLKEGGFLCANLGGFGFDDPLVRTVARTAARAFEDPVLLMSVPHSRNYTLFARRGAALPWEGNRLADAGREVADVLHPRELPGFFQRIEADEQGGVLVDNQAPVEILQKRSIEEGHRRRLGGGGAG